MAIDKTKTAGPRLEGHFERDALICDAYIKIHTAYVNHMYDLIFVLVASRRQMPIPNLLHLRMLVIATQDERHWGEPNAA